MLAVCFESVDGCCSLLFAGCWLLFDVCGVMFTVCCLLVDV